MKLQVLLFSWMLLGSAVESVSLPEITDGNFIEECVKEHNRARSAVSPPARDMLYMTWDEGLAITARAWARHCLFEHNIYLEDARRVHPKFSSVGENLWAAFPPSQFSVRRAVNNSWVNEKIYYDYDKNNCRKEPCGHYTQVVWASSYKVGCAVQLCRDGVKETSFAHQQGVIFVCNYATAGNFDGEKPYESGEPACSKCDGTCVDKLCRSPERDALQRYNWTPDWDPALKSSGTSYVAVLVTRPVALICTFVAAYVVHHFYPNVFCYE
ncbi:GLIPR1-like protein 1 [Synchiropus splendidus]|uniref:GLIPR1-like protein 1 n=1 Tax=Synchiropus splendidus TaxID=270530 RepID=UPI00237D5C3D|nr:GLIPR1-like protein 1 [Synchiropus splendidus]